MTAQNQLNSLIFRELTFDQHLTNQTNYLVIGSRSSPDWITENFGRKIQKAAEMASSGDFEIAIIREADWAMQVKPKNIGQSW